jgi:inhibitor of KinA
MGDFVVRHAGDSAIVADFPPRLGRDVSEQVVALAEALAARRRPGVRDVVVGYHSVTVYFDPLVAGEQDLVRWLSMPGERPAARTAGRTLTVPVMYGGEWGPDLENVAAFAGCCADEVVTLHSAATYRVYMLGFVPGFAYMASVDPRIAAPRRATPRVAVPAGSVGIAGPQTGIYPMVTPGGWNLIGRTPVIPFDAGRDEPCLFRPGDDVRFVPLDRWPR